MGGSVPYVLHGEVWALIAGAIGLGVYAARIIQPRAVALGYPAITGRQKLFYVLAVVLMWLSSDYPVHDVAENYLYAVHMLQHMLLSMVIPALFVLATPRWLMELVVPPDSTVWGWLRFLSKPVTALVIFNLLTITLHFPLTVDVSARSGAVHFGLHLMVFAAGLVMWMPVMGPIEEWRLTPLGQCVYLFGMSIVPTVPSGFLIFSQGVVYDHYADAPVRLFGLSVMTDQTAAGLVMKLGGGFFLWATIIVIFARWVSGEARKDREARRRRASVGGSHLTYEEVAEHFAKSPAPAEQ